MVIQNNIMAMTAQRHSKINSSNNKKTIGKLSSGYKVNQSADDAASLAISEKMRLQIRGLRQGTANAIDGISFTQVGEGALNEATDIIKRMSELAVHSLNEVLSDNDRAMLQDEFKQLQTEIDRISKVTTFNEQKVFEEHESNYFTIEGNKYWDYTELHTIDSYNNTLTLQLKQSLVSGESEKTISVPPGTYTTQELIDEIDSALSGSGSVGSGFNIEYTSDGTVHANYENGVDIVSLSGGLSYLFYDSYDKGSLGSLLGTTLFIDNYPLEVSNQNNELGFTLVDFYGNTKDVSMKLATGYYDRQQIMDMINSELTTLGLSNVEALAYGDSSIQIASEDYFVTGLKGNMFKVDDPAIENIYTSVFYDNIKYGTVVETQAVFKGGAILLNSTTDTDHNRFVITGDNNKLLIRANGNSAEPYVKLTLTAGSYTASQMTSLLNNAFAANSLSLTATYYSEYVSGAGTFYGLQITSAESGVDSKIEFDIAGSSAYDTLFRNCSYTTFRSNYTYTTGAYSYTSSYATGAADLTEFPLTISEGGDKFGINVNGTYYEIALEQRGYSSLSDLITEIDDKINGINAPAGLKDKVTVSASGSNICFTPVSSSGISTLSLSAVSVIQDIRTCLWERIQPIRKGPPPIPVPAPGHRR